MVVTLAPSSSSDLLMQNVHKYSLKVQKYTSRRSIFSFKLTSPSLPIKKEEYIYFKFWLIFPGRDTFTLTQLHSERPKLYTILAFLSAVGLEHLLIFPFSVPSAAPEMLLSGYSYVRRDCDVSRERPVAFFWKVGIHRISEIARPVTVAW